MQQIRVLSLLIFFSQVAGKSIFDQLEDKDADECIAIMKKLSDATAKK